MSTNQPTSAALRLFVPLYLLVVGVGLIVSAVLLFIYLPDDIFVGVMAGVGGLTMIVTMALLLTAARGR